MTRIFYTDVSKLSNEALFSAFFKSASPERQRKINSLKQNRDKRLSLGAYICYTQAMREFNADAKAEWAYTEKGKPYFKDNMDLHFSLAHSDNIAVCAVSDRKVGTDIERIWDFKDGVCRRYFALNEARYVFGALSESEKKERFFRIWTLKEAYSKMTGRGIGGFADFNIIPQNPVGIKSRKEYTDAHFTELAIEDYALAVCTEGADEDIKIQKLNILKLLINI